MRLAGVRGAIPRDEAEVIAAWMVQARRVPGPSQFVEWLKEDDAGFGAI